MLGVFSGEVVEAPAELLAAGSRTPSPKTRASELVGRFVRAAEVAPAGDGGAVSVQVSSLAHLAYSHHHHTSRGGGGYSPFRRPRLFAAKDDVYCLFEGTLDNLGSLRQDYGLSKANEVLLIVEAYKALRDRAPYPPSSMLSHLDGRFAFILFDARTSSLLVASDQEGKVQLYWGITADGYIAFANDIDLLKGSCGKSLAPFPQGCFFSNTLGGLKCYENPKNKITAVPADEEEICGATFKVEGPAALTATF